MHTSRRVYNFRNLRTAFLDDVTTGTSLLRIFFGVLNDVAASPPTLKLTLQPHVSVCEWLAAVVGDN